MAWVRCCAGTKKVDYLYNEGNFAIPFDSVGGYTAGVTLIPCTYNTDNIELVSGSNNCAIIGTTNAINVTDKNMVKVIAKSSNVFAIGVHSTKNINTSVAYKPITGNNNYTEYFIDVSNLSGNYYIAFTAMNGNSCNIKKIWVE